ncbi:hypothetical protein EVAR_75259_1 [Eumeta japonica]|uniref:Uncharacterized protein n=1 Tax=Eumeta variegata TaxID=151549 RepID=A0A4C1V8Z7_EUMVA|nr:hypothetical protein EVAR_75259_1 [Eumeta japonica]
MIIYRSITSRKSRKDFFLPSATPVWLFIEIGFMNESNIREQCAGPSRQTPARPAPRPRRPPSRSMGKCDVTAAATTYHYVLDVGIFLMHEPTSLQIESDRRARTSVPIPILSSASFGLFKTVATDAVTMSRIDSLRIRLYKGCALNSTRIKGSLVNLPVIRDRIRYLIYYLKVTLRPLGPLRSDVGSG